MSDTKNKAVFKRALKGDPVAYDMFNNAIIEGDIVLYATTVSQSAIMKIGKIIGTKEIDCYGRSKRVKIQIRRLERSRNGVWIHGVRPSYIERLDNAFLLSSPPQEILDKFTELDS